MSNEDTLRETLDGSIPIAAVLGLRDSDGVDWTRLRGLQLATVARHARIRMAAHIVLGLVTVWTFFGSVSLASLALWFGVLCVVHIRGGLADFRLIDAERRRVTMTEFRRPLITPIGSAITWSVATLAFAPSAGMAEQVILWSSLAVLIAASILFYSAAPMGVFIFASVVGAASIVNFTIQGHPEMVLLVTAMVATALAGSIEIARTTLSSRMAESRVREKEEVVSLLLREFEENEADWLWQIDTARRLRAVSPRFAFALGRQQAEAEGRPLFELIGGKNWESGDLPPSLHDLIERIKAQENFSNLLVKVSIRGEQRWWELSGTPIRDKNGNFGGFRGVGSDVTEQRESSEKIAYLAKFDTLTSLPNRVQVNEALGEALRYSEQWKTTCAFLMIDLDRFKAVNDSLGHQVGDKLLAQVSERLQSIMGENQLCGRLGGDEFAVVIRDASNKKVVSEVANKVITLLSKPYRVDDQTLHVGASVGSAIGPRDGSTVEELMRNADLALYRAKDNGRGGHFGYVPSLHASAEERRQLELSLREALEREELTLQFQPVVNAQDSSIVSFEALSRWNSEEHGFVSPTKFIPIAEDTRLIVPIGKWVMRKACTEARNWPEHVKVNVNVSPEQLLEEDFAEDVVNCLAQTGLRPERLEIEVTESIFLRDASIARAALEQVLALGCQVALDDFGTGYSSLGYIRRLRFSTIKVDRTFVKGAAQNNAESLAIIRAVVAMAQSLDMSTTAEGAETAEEVELIRKLGCDKIQGYYFGRPMTATDARRLFRDPQELRRA
ncbi:EAL domain-containing protein [Altererythrobacter arenosus]|uniref:EAL domain-containing protein n=1 Tax=Altererythrobacter arenosus TaxID=3032592 RepID=A0ABY8FX99_9SPHN|nr:GGDEF and EAL domain-containing protein [Altererythrobacter sp. CAU 1644]WFL77871.1 EAL domain-containing protein [Altererythrobacter sp. CAU 1644]